MRQRVPYKVGDFNLSELSDSLLSLLFIEGYSRPNDNEDTLMVCMRLQHDIIEEQNRRLLVSRQQKAMKR